MSDPIPSVPSDPVTAVADAVAEGAAAVAQVQSEKNAPAVVASVEEQREADAKATTAKAIATGDIAEIRKEAAE